MRTCKECKSKEVKFLKTNLDNSETWTCGSCHNTFREKVIR